MTKLLRIPMYLLLALSLSGCMGTLVSTPTREGKPIVSTQVHILAAPYRIDAHTCSQGISRAEIFIPLWGVAVGILTLGIVVPKTTIYTCVGGAR